MYCTGFNTGNSPFPVVIPWFVVQFQTESEALVEIEKVNKKLSLLAEGLGETCCHPAEIGTPHKLFTHTMQVPHIGTVEE